MVITDYGVEFPDGTVQTTACDCIDLLGDIPNVSVPESSGDIEENSYLYFNHTLNLWISARTHNNRLSRYMRLSRI